MDSLGTTAVETQPPEVLVAQEEEELSTIPMVVTGMTLTGLEEEVSSQMQVLETSGLSNFILQPSTLSLDQQNKSEVNVQQPNLRLPQPNLRLPQPNLRLSHPNLRLGQPNLCLSQPNLRLTQPNLRLPQPNLILQAQPQILLYDEQQTDKALDERTLIIHTTDLEGASALVPLAEEVEAVGVGKEETLVLQYIESEPEPTAATAVEADRVSEETSKTFFIKKLDAEKENNLVEEPPDIKSPTDNNLHESEKSESDTADEERDEDNCVIIEMEDVDGTGGEVSCIVYSQSNELDDGRPSPELSESGTDTPVLTVETVVASEETNLDLPTRTHNEIADEVEEVDAAAGNCIVYRTDVVGEEDKKENDDRYRVSTSRRDSSGNLVLELVEKEKNSSKELSEYVTLSWGAGVRSNPPPPTASIPSSSIPMPLDGRLPEILFNDYADKILSIEEETSQSADEAGGQLTIDDIEDVTTSGTSKQSSKKKIKKKIPDAKLIDENNCQCKEKDCQKVFKGKSKTLQYQRHYERVHLQIKHHICQFCHFRFYGKHDLVRHCESVHNKIKTICPIVGCNKLIVRLDLHVKKVHQENATVENKENICSECGQIFNRVYDMKRHKDTVHLGWKKYKCDVCERGFSDKRDLLRHHNAVHLKIKQETRKIKFFLLL